MPGNSSFRRSNNTKKEPQLEQHDAENCVIGIICLVSVVSPSLPGPLSSPGHQHWVGVGGIACLVFGAHELLKQTFQVEG